MLTEVGDLVLVEASPNGYKELGSAHVIEGQGLHGPCVRQWEGVCAKHQRRCRVLGFQQQVSRPCSHLQR